MIDQVFARGLKVIEDLQNTQTENLYKASELIAEAIYNGHKFFVTGSGHSHTVAEEFYGRAGGMACMVPILTPELTLVDHPTKSTYLEQVFGDSSYFQDGFTFLVSIVFFIIGLVYGIGSHRFKNDKDKKMGKE